LQETIQSKWGNIGDIGDQKPNTKSVHFGKQQQFGIEEDRTKTVQNHVIFLSKIGKRYSEYHEVKVMVS
jgi:hypothetical protein